MADPAAPLDLEVIVNGQPVRVPAGPIRHVIADAVQRSGQIGAPPEQWELRTTDGEVIPHHALDGTEFELAPGKRLWLTLGVPRRRTYDELEAEVERLRASLKAGAAHYRDEELAHLRAENQQLRAAQTWQAVRQAFQEGWIASCNMAGTLSEEECWKDSQANAALPPAPEVPK